MADRGALERAGFGNAGVLGLYLLLAVAYFAPSIAGGYLLAPGDGMSVMYPRRLIASLIAPESPLQLWNPYLYAGSPFLGSIDAGAYYPPNWLIFALDPVVAFDVLVVGHFALAGFALYLYLRELGADGVSAFMGGAVFAFSGFMAAHLQHTTIVHAAPWPPLILYLIERERRRPHRMTPWAVAIATALLVLAGHPQVLLYGMLVVAATLVAGLFRVERGRRARFAAATAGGLMMGAVIALPQLVATYDLAGISPRANMTYEYFTAFSFPPHMLPALVAPFLWGGGYGGRYWGPFTDTTGMEGYAGILPLVLAMAAIAVCARRDGRVRFWGIVLVAAALLSLGKYLPGYRLVYHIPLFNYFRASSRHWYEADLAIAVLFALGLAHVRRDGARRPVVPVALAALAVIGGLLVMGSTVLRGPVLGVISARLAPMRPEAGARALALSGHTILIPLLLATASAGALLLLARWPRGRVAAVVLAVVLSLDAASYRTGFGQGAPAAEVRGICDSGAIGFLVKAGPGRTAFLHESMKPLQGAMCGLRMIDGYEQLVDTRYTDLLGLDTRGIYADGARLAENNTVLSMLGVRYLVVSQPMAPVIENIRVPEVPKAEGSALMYAPPFSYRPYAVPGYRERLYRKVYEGGGAIVYENPNAMPRVWAVRRLLKVPGAGMKGYLMGTPLDPSLVALASDAGLPRGGAGFSPGAVEVVSDLPGRVEMRADFPEGDGFVVLSEHYVQGWRAEIDGLSAEPVRVDGVLQGVRVPRGSHAVVFFYRPPRMLVAMALSAAVLLVLLAAVLKEFWCGRHT